MRMVNIDDEAIEDEQFEGGLDLVAVPVRSNLLALFMSLLG